MFSIAVDAMSGEKDPQAAVTATLRMARAQPKMRFILAGRESLLAPLLAAAPSNVRIENANDVIDMNASPTSAIRRRDSSMRRALMLVANNEAQAMVSAGNTGALLGLSVMLLGKIEGIHRPAIASFLPNMNLSRGCCMLDLGANVECSEHMLQQFALMGAALVKVVRHIDKPSVGLLNVGEEYFKGSEQIQRAGKMLQQMSDINFIGNVEGFDIFQGKCDVIVCDGFTGNVALKTSEGLALMISGMIKNAFGRNYLSRLCGALAYPVLSWLRSSMDTRRYNGACILGLPALVVKSHGNADDVAFYSALNYARQAGEQGLSDAINTTLRQEILPSDATGDTIL